jgi:hypothetical protein
VLQSQLRLAHIKEGEKEIRQICPEYTDVFKLPGDRLTATLAITHYIPSAYFAELQDTGASPKRGRNPNSKDARG